MFRIDSMAQSENHNQKENGAIVNKSYKAKYLLILIVVILPVLIREFIL